MNIFPIDADRENDQPVQIELDETARISVHDRDNGSSVSGMAAIHTSTQQDFLARSKFVLLVETPDWC